MPAYLSTTTYRFRGIPTADAVRARLSSGDDYGNVLEPVVDAEGGSPCRHCLRRTKAGERVVLFSYSPFDVRNPYKEVGPIFVHADGCEPYLGANWPADFPRVVLRAYDARQRIVTGIVADGDCEERLAAFFARDDIAFVDARSASHGCWLFRVERSG